MTAIDMLLNRRSVSPKLMGGPGPSDAEIDLMLKAGARAADHGRLRPWRFVVVRGEARAKLGDVFAQARALRDPQANAAEIEKERAKPLRSPVVLAVGARVLRGHATVRAIDQTLAAAAAAQNILLAAFALGYGAMWLTGTNCHDPKVKAALGFGAEDEMVGYLYIGTVEEIPPPLPVEDLAGLKVEWSGPPA